MERSHPLCDLNWKPFKHVEDFRKKEGIYRPAFLGVIEDVIGRTFDCDCQMLNDRKEVARRRCNDPLESIPIKLLISPCTLPV